MMNNILVGYARKSNEGIKVSINIAALSDCDKYTTSDRQEYVALTINRLALEKVLSGERAVTTIFQINEEVE
tara:strand:+ start:535 stop:750 length:216 start_codon:yes stop_codon:yes gene_type:complete